MKTMRFCAAVVLTVVAACSVSAFAQADVHSLQEALHGKQLGLRSYSADPVTSYLWADGKLVVGPVQLHGLEVFVDNSVQLKGRKIVFMGSRETLVRNKSTLAQTGRSPMTLQVDLQGADPAVVIPQLQEALFFPHLQEAIDDLPKIVAHMLPGQIDESVWRKIDPALAACDCYRIFKDGDWVDVKKSEAKYMNPILIKQPDVEFSKEASESNISGTVRLSLHVSNMGRVDDVWLLRPMGYGLDQNAGSAVRQYVFQPAKLNGKPIDSVLNVEVNFQSGYSPAYLPVSHQ
jgi:protein TonB